MSVEIMDAESLERALLDPEWREAPITETISPLTAFRLEHDLEVEIPNSLPRILVGVGAAPTAAAPDIIVSSEDELGLLAGACERTPLAVIVLAQLLRTSERLDVESALVAESFAYSTLLNGSEFARWRAAQAAPRHRASSEAVLLEDDGETLTLTLNRPEVQNAYDAVMRDALIDVLRSVHEMYPTRAVRLCGNGPSFSSGGDLSEFGTNGDAAFAHLVRTSRAPGLLLHRLGDRATARVHGSCIGAGTELPAFCSHVHAHPDTTFRLPEISMGLIPGAGGTVSLTRRIGRQRTMWLATTGAAVSAPTAHGWGLVDALSS